MFLMNKLTNLLLKSTTIITTLQNKGLVIYHYFDFRDGHKTTYTGLLSSILYQLGSRVAEMQMKALYKESKQSKISDATMEEFIANNVPQGNKTYIVIDAFDECQQGDQHQVTKFIQDMCMNRSVHLFVSCRYAVQNLKMASTILLDYELSRISDDIGQHIDKAFETEKIKFLSMQNEIKVSLVEGAHGVCVKARVMV